MNATDMLRDADPLRHETVPEDARWARMRRRIVDEARAPGAQTASRRRFVLVTAGAAAAVLAVGTTALRPWGGTTLQAAMRFEVRLAEDTANAAPGGTAIEAGARRLYLHQDVVLSNDDIASAHVIGSEEAGYGVQVLLTADGAAKMRAATEEHVGRPLAVLVDGAVLAAPVVRSAIDQVGVISGSYTQAEAEALATGLVRR